MADGILLCHLVPSWRWFLWGISPFNNSSRERHRGGWESFGFPANIDSRGLYQYHVQVGTPTGNLVCHSTDVFTLSLNMDSKAPGRASPSESCFLDLVRIQYAVGHQPCGLDYAIFFLVSESRSLPVRPPFATTTWVVTRLNHRTVPGWWKPISTIEICEPAQLEWSTTIDTKSMITAYITAKQWQRGHPIIDDII